jgi:hypothetical protein
MSVHVPAITDLSKYIEARWFGERPHIRGRRVPLAMIAPDALTTGRLLKQPMISL